MDLLTMEIRATIIKRHGEQATPGISGECSRATTVENFLSRGAGSGDEQFYREQPFVKPGTSRVRARFAPRGEI